MICPCIHVHKARALCTNLRSIGGIRGKFDQSHLTKTKLTGEIPQVGNQYKVRNLTIQCTLVDLNQGKSRDLRGPGQPK